MLTLLDVRLMVDRSLDEGHFWDGTSFRKTGRPVALCGIQLYPRDPSYFMTPTEMKQVPFCKKCLSKVKR